MCEMCLFHGFYWIKVDPVMRALALLHCGLSLHIYAMIGPVTLAILSMD